MRLLPALVCSVLLLPSVALAVTVSQTKRQQAGTPGNFNYTFAYKCSNGRTGKLTLSSSNDNSARALAEQEALEKCGE